MLSVLHCLAHADRQPAIYTKPSEFSLLQLQRVADFVIAALWAAGLEVWYLTACSAAAQIAGFEPLTQTQLAEHAREHHLLPVVQAGSPSLQEHIAAVRAAAGAADRAPPRVRSVQVPHPVGAANVKKFQVGGSAGLV